MRVLNVSFIDTDTYSYCKQHSIVVHSVFPNTLNLLAGDTILTVSPRVGKAKHTIVVEEIDFATLAIEQNDPVTVVDNTLRCRDVTLKFEPSAIAQIMPYNTTFTRTNKTREMLRALEEWIEKQDKTSRFKFDTSDVTLRYQFEKIDAFLFDESWEHAKQIIGLGIGLTPMGDDILLGYIIARQSIGRPLPYEQLILDYIQEHTTVISAQMLRDALNHYYAEHFIHLIEGVFIQHTTDVFEPFLYFGDTSGIAILTGFLYGVREDEII